MKTRKVKYEKNMQLQNKDYRNTIIKPSNQCGNKWIEKKDGYIGKGSFGFTTTACCDNNCNYVAKVTKYNKDERHLFVDEFKNEVLLQKQCSEKGYCPDVYGAWYDNKKISEGESNYGVIIMDKAGFIMTNFLYFSLDPDYIKNLFQYKGEIDNKLTVSQVLGRTINYIVNLNREGIFHNDLHTDNILIEPIKKEKFIRMMYKKMLNDLSYNDIIEYIIDEIKEIIENNYKEEKKEDEDIKDSIKEKVNYNSIVGFLDKYNIKHDKEKIKEISNYEDRLDFVRNIIQNNEIEILSNFIIQHFDEKYDYFLENKISKLFDIKIIDFGRGEKNMERRDKILGGMSSDVGGLIKDIMEITNDPINKAYTKILKNFIEEKGYTNDEMIKEFKYLNYITNYVAEVHFSDWNF